MNFSIGFLSVASDALKLEGISTTSAPMDASSRQWYRQKFYDHPELQRGSLSAFANVREKRVKVACKLCFDTGITTEREPDEDEFKNGLRLQLRSQTDIVD